MSSGLDLNFDTVSELDNKEDGPVNSGGELLETEKKGFERGIAESGGKVLEVEFRERSTTVGFETMKLGDGFGADQKLGSDRSTLRSEKIEVRAERLEATSVLRSEQIEVRADGGGECLDGQLDLDERKVEGESIRLKLIEVETGEKGRSEAVDLANQGGSLGNVFGGDRKHGIDVDADGIVVDCQLGSGEMSILTGGNQKKGTDSDVELGLGDKRSAELVDVSAVGFEAVEASGHPTCLGDGFDDEQNRVIDVKNEDMVGTDEDFTVLSRGEVAEDESLEGSSNLREEQAEVELMDEGVQAVDDQLGPEEREAESKSLCINLLEMDTGGSETVDLVALEASNQAVMKMGSGMSESADLVAVSAKEFEAVEVSNEAASGDDQEQRIDLDAEGMVIDGQLGSGERDAEVKSLVGKCLEVDKGVEGSAVLVSVSVEEFQPVEAGRHAMDFHGGSDGDQKGGAVLDAEGMVIDGELGSGKRQAEVEVLGGKLLAMDRGDKEATVLVSASTESFVCSQAMDLSDGSGDDQRLGTGLNAENMVGSNGGSVAVSVGSGRELWGKEKRSLETFSVSAEVFEPVETSSQENLLHRSGDDQRLVADVDAESMVRINENSTTISVDSGGPGGERSHASLVLTKEEVEVRVDLDHGIVQAVDNEPETRNEADFKSYSGRCMETDMREKGSIKLVGASHDLFESVEASSEAVNLGDGSGGDQKQRVDVDMKGLMGTDEVLLTALVVGGGADPEKMEESSILRKEQLEIQLDLLVESDLAAGPRLGCGDKEAEVNSHEGMPVEMLTMEKESAGLVAASAEDFDAIEASNQGMNSGDNSGGEQMQGIDADAKDEDLHVQSGPGSRDVEVKSHSRKLLEVDKTAEESAEPFAVSTEIFEPVEPSSEAMNFGDGSDGDQKRETDVNVESLAMDAEWSSAKSVAEVEPIGEKFLEVNRDDEESTELPAASTEGGFLPCQADSEPMKLVDGSGDQKLETDVDAESMVSTDEFSVALSITNGAPDDAKFVGSLILRKHVEVQDNMVDGIFEVVEGELGSPTNVTEVKSYGEGFMEVDTGEKESTKLVAASAERSVTVEVSSQTMDLGDGSSSDQIQRTDADAEGMLRNEDSVTVLVVDGAPGNERLERSCGDLTQQIDASAKTMVDISDDSAAVPDGGGCPEDERLEEKSSVLGIEHVKALSKLADGCRQVADGELIHEESSPIIESHGGMLLGVETGVKVGVEPFIISAEGCDAVEGCSQEMDVEHGSDGDQRKQTDVSSDYMVGTSGDHFNVSGSNGGLEDESLERSLILGKDHTEVLQDLVDGHDHISDGESGPREREDEVEPHCEKLLELDVREKGAEQSSIPAGGSAAVEASSQDMDYEDRNFCEQKQESNIGAACMFETVEVSVVVSVDGGGPEAEMLNGSSNLVKEVEVGEETLGTCSTVKDLPESTKNDSADYNDTTIRVMQVQTEFDGGQKQDSDVGVEAMMGGTEKASLAVSIGSGGPEDERLETSYKFGEKQVDDGEDDIGHGMLEKILIHPEKIEGDVVDARRDSGNVKDSVHSKHVEDMDSRVGFVGDLSAESCMETDAKPLVVAIVHQGTEAQGLEVAPGSDDEQVKAKSGCDESQIVEKDEHFQKSGDSLNVDVCDLVEGRPDEREGEIIGDNGHNLTEVNSVFSAGEVNVCEKGLACLPECVEAVHDLMDHALDDRDPGSEGYDKERLETYGKQDVSLESFQGSELMGEETSIVHHSTVGSEQVEVLTQASSVENDLKIFDENNTAADQTIQKSDSIPVIGEQDTDLQVEDEDQKSAVACGGTFGFFDVAKTTMALDAVNVEAWSSDEHTAVDSMAEKGNVLLEDNGSVMSAELQNGDEQVEQLNFDHQNQKIDSSSLMVSCKEEAVHAVGSDSLGDFFMEKGYGIMEDSNSLLGISIPDSSTESTITLQWNDTSVGCQDVQPPNILSTEHKELEHEQRTPAVGSALHAVDETIDYSQKLQDGTQDNLKESDNQNEGCDSTRTEAASTSEQATYYLSFPEKESFSTSDLVWGKVKSHPWWPGQIFDFSGASQLAIKYQKKDHFLVTYFGDKTFAWCEESRLKPFQLFFSQMEKQTSSDSFLRALHDILAEISRRVELSMTCMCLPEEAYADIKYQKIENAGLRGKIVDSVFDRCEIVNYFHPDRLIEYVRELALLPTGGADRLDLTVAQAQLKAFYLSKGYTELPAFTNGSGLVENDFETPSSMNKKLNEDDLEHTATLSDLFSTKGKLRSKDGTLGKPKQIVEDGRKQKSLSELMEEETTFLLVNNHENASEAQDDESCLSCGNKRKALDFVSIDIGRSKTKKIDSQGDEETKLLSPTSNSSFKVGAFISRAASKLTSGQPMRKCHGETSERGLSRVDDWSVDYMDLDDFIDVPFDYPKLQIDISEDYPPANEMLSKLCLAARNPLKGFNFSSVVIKFFCTFRNVHVSNISIEKNMAEKPRAKRGRKKKIILDLGSPDMSTPDHMKDSYWSDMVVPEKDGSLNPPKRRGRKKRKFIDESSPSLLLNSPSDCELKLHTGTMCPHVKHIMIAERPIISVEEKIVDERTPTAVILSFNSSNSLPSETDLIRIFSRYGPLKEEETYIERKNNSAMVVFKKRTDAEMAFSSAGKFSTFGSALLSYRLRHFPFKSPSSKTMIGEDDSIPIKGDLGIMAEPEFNGALDGTLCEAVDKESDMESSIFVQSQGNFEPVLDMTPGEFSELSQYQAGDAVISDSALSNMERKEPLQDIPDQMESGAGSDHLLLESLDQEFSYFDLDQTVTGDISEMATVGEKSSGLLLETVEVSHVTNDRSLGEESCDPVTGAERGTVLETTTQLEAVDQELSASAHPAESKDISDEINITPDQPGEKKYSDSPPAHVGTGTSDQSSVVDVPLMEADSCAMEAASDSTQVELGRQDPSVSVVANAESTGIPPQVTEGCISEQRII